MAKGEHSSFNLYIPAESQELLKEFGTIEKETAVSMSKLIVASMMACVDALKKEVPDKRKFKLHGKEIQL